MKNVWMRLGIMLNLTEEEVALVLGDDEDVSELTIRKVIEERRFISDGDSYIPANIIEDFNRENGTSYNSDTEHSLCF